jgi:hypothetical protein
MPWTAAAAFHTMTPMNMKSICVALILFAGPAALWAEGAAPAKTLALLKIAMGKSGLAGALFAQTEEGMRKTIAERSGYDVRPVDLALGPDETALLFDRLKNEQGEAAAPGEAVTIGETTIPAETYALLLEASVLVIPAVADCAIVEDKRQGGATFYKVTLKTSFDFIKRDGEPSRVTRLVETMGYDADRDRALADAIKTVVPMFAYELAAIEELKPAAAILTLENGEAIIERGAKQGVVLGTEFSVRGAREEAGGQTIPREKGLIVVSEVTDDASAGSLAYADPDVEAGDAVEEVPRLGVDLVPYAFAFIPLGLTGEVSWYTGVRVVLAKGVYTLRPFVSAEFSVYPFSTYQYWFPVRPFLGVELRFRFGRLELAALPMVGLEEWFALAPGEESLFMGFGLRGIVQIGLLVSRDARVFLEGGYEYWFGNRQGFLAGAGISIKL